MKHAKETYDPSLARYEDHSDVILAHKSYVYRCRDAQSRFLYIGLTVTAYPVARLTGHRSKPWWGKVATVEWAEFEEPFTAREEETYQIHRWHPPFNDRCPQTGCQVVSASFQEDTR